MIRVNVEALAFVVGTVIPVLVALVTKAHASPGVKAVVNALLSGLAGVIVVAIAQNGEIPLTHDLVAIGIVWFTSVATHFGLLKPLSVTGSNGAVAQSTRSVGVG